MKKIIKAGAVDQTLDLFVADSASTTGGGKTGLAYNTASLVAYYRKGATGTPTALTLATQTVGGAHSDGGFVELDATNMPGMYRLDLSDTIVATAGSVSLMLKGASGMAPVTIELQVVAVNLEDAVRLGLTALPNAAADAAGGLVISDAGGLDADALRSDVAAILVDTGTTLDGRIPSALVGGRIDASVGAMAADVMTAAAAAADLTTELQSGLATAANLATVAGYLDTEIAAILEDTADMQPKLGTPAGLSLAADLAAVKVDTAAILVDTGTTLDGRIPAALVSGRMDASVGAIAANAITAAATAADFGAEIADAVWDEATSGHSTAGTTGKALTDAGSAGTPLDAAGVRAAVGLASANLDTQLDALPTNAELATALGTADDAVLSAIAALNNLSSAQAQTAAAAALTAYDPPTNAEMEARTLTAALIAKLTAHLGGVLTVVVGSGSTTTAVVLNASTGINSGAPSSVNDHYKDAALVFLTGTLAGQRTSISSYAGATVTATVVALTSAPSAGDTAILV